MKNTINSLLAISAVAMLAACGGGGNSDQGNIPQTNTNTPAVASTFANMGVFAPSGQSISMNLVNCTTFVFPGRTPLIPSTATLVINATGDVTFNYAGSSSPLIAPVSQTISASNAVEAKLELSASPGFSENFYDAYIEDNAGYQVNLRYYPDGTGKYVIYRSSSAPQTEITCDLDSSVVLSASMGNYNARIAAATAGITTANQFVAVSSNFPTVTLASPSATWQNDMADANVLTRLNINTGEVAVSTSAGGGFTVTDIGQLVLPANGSIEPNYSELFAADRSGRTYREFRYSDNLTIDKRNFSFRITSGTDLAGRYQY